MHRARHLIALSLALLLTALGVAGATGQSQTPPVAQTPPMAEEVTLIVLGRAVNSQGLAISEAEVSLFVGGERQPLVSPDGDPVEEIASEPDGLFRLVVRLPGPVAEAIASGRRPVAIEINAHAFRETRLGVPARLLAWSSDHLYADVGEVIMPRAFHPAFFVTLIIFLLTFIAISFRLLHETLAAMGGATLLLAITYLPGSYDPDWHIISFERAMHHIDFDVIFLILGLMIFVAITGRTGVFQWMAYTAYRASRGNAWALVAILILTTAVTSAFLNNVTIMLLIAPVTVEIALMMGINPLALLVPETLASNIGGTATLIGDPPNTLIGSYAHLSFASFLTNLGPLVIVLTLLFVGIAWFLYRAEYRKARTNQREVLEAHLAEAGRIEDPVLLRKAGIMAVVTLVLFFLGDLLQMPPAVAALIGAVGLMIWAQPSVHDMVQEVDWTTLLFFMSLFILVGALEDIGAIQLIAEGIGRVAGDNLSLAVLLILWIPALGSAVTENIPFAAAMLPVAGYLTQTIPGADNNVIYWALALGTDLGGNATTIGAAANIVTAGIAERAGYPLSFKTFAKIGVPATLLILVVSTLYLMVRY
ncbi:MAG TPA: ArsB/NhaD family transporter [Caldilineae bacterium]|nr:ArsB/NhaD family transporter [Caldilineae bacterium]